MKLPLSDKGSLKINIFFACFAIAMLIIIILLFQLGFRKCFIVAMWDIGWPGYWLLSMIFIVYPLGITVFFLLFFTCNDRRTWSKAAFGQVDYKKLQLGGH